MESPKATGDELCNFDEWLDPPWIQVILRNSQSSPRWSQRRDVGQLDDRARHPSAVAPHALSTEIAGDDNATQTKCRAAVVP